VAEFRMPSLGADMEAGTLIEWRVRPGDTVRRGDIVAAVDTDKAVIEVECWEDGIVDALLVAPGTKVPVGTPLARLRTLGAAAAAPPEPRSLETPPQPAGGRVHATPLARRAAEELGVDLAGLRGTGPGGAVTHADVERAAAERTPLEAPAARGAVRVPPARGSAPAPERDARAAGIRRAIGAAMARSKREIPHYYLAVRIDLSRALAWLAAENAPRPVAERVLPAALLLRAVALAAREVPELNGFFEEGGFRPVAAVHLGVAIALREGGLVAPALLDADRKGVRDVMSALADLVRRARGGGLRSSELGSATLTVTNLGDLGVESVYGVIYPPQVALVGFGRVGEQPWASGGLFGVRPVVTATLAADHRASDGHRGGRFLSAVDRLLQEPEKL